MLRHRIINFITNVRYRKESVMKKQRNQVEPKELKQKVYTEVMSIEDRREMERLSRELQDIDVESVNYIQNQVMPPSQSDFDRMNKFFHAQMFDACLQPLERGLSPSSIMQSFLMYKTMTLLNKDFRNTVHSTVSKMMLPVVEKRASMPNAPESVRKRRDAVLREANNGRLPLDEHTTALIRVGICRNAYNMSREPGADIDEVMQQYNQAIENLEKCAEQDGVDMDASNQDMRTIVGRFMETDSQYADIYQETSFMNVEKCGYHEEIAYVIGDDGSPESQKSMVWRGEFASPDGMSYEGPFTPRFPQTMESYQSYISNEMFAQMQSCGTDGVKMYHSLKDCSRMYASDDKTQRWMSMDGLSDDDIKTVYEGAFKSALGNIRDTNPELYSDFERHYYAEKQRDAKRSNRGHEFDDMFGGTESAYDSSYQC